MVLMLQILKKKNVYGMGEGSITETAMKLFPAELRGISLSTISYFSLSFCPVSAAPRQ